MPAEMTNRDTAAGKFRPITRLPPANIIIRAYRRVARQDLIPSLMMTLKNTHHHCIRTEPAQLAGAGLVRRRHSDFRSVTRFQPLRARFMIFVLNFADMIFPKIKVLHSHDGRRFPDQADAVELSGSGAVPC